MKTTVERWALAIILFAITACSAKEQAIDPAVHEAEILQWRIERLASLKSPDGYLNLVGLYWLDEGRSRVGSAADNDIVFPANAAPFVGELQTSADGVVFAANPAANVRYEDIPVRSLLISDDTTVNPVELTHESFGWTIIKRDGRFALRLRDFEHPAIAAFPPFEYFPINVELRVTATLQRFDEPKILDVKTTIEGLGYRPESPGTVVFDLGGKTHELEAYASGDELFFVFADATTGRETYPAGRFLYAAVPGDDGKTILDFNRAYSPPCAFNAFGTCPVASPRNRLQARVEAGEKYDPAVHLLPDGYD